MTTTNNEGPKQKGSIVTALIGLTMLAGAVYLIWQGIKLLTMTL